MFTRVDTSRTLYHLYNRHSNIDSLIYFVLSKANEFQLMDGKYSMVKGNGTEFPIQVRKMGLYMVVVLKQGLVLMWDQKTSLFIRLSATYQVNRQWERRQKLQITAPQTVKQIQGIHAPSIQTPGTIYSIFSLAHLLQVCLKPQEQTHVLGLCLDRTLRSNLSGR